MTSPFDKRLFGGSTTVMKPSIQGQPHDRSALILYGSETGNSQEAAEQLGRITERLRFVTQVIEMNHVELNRLQDFTVIIFTISTTGQGDIPANARTFWKSLLKKRLPMDCLSHVRFTTFGFGDSSYVKFNWASRKLHKRLQQLGAQEFYPRGEADEQHPEGAEAAFLPWSLDFKTQLLEKYPLPDGTYPISDSELLPPKWTLDLADSSKINKNSKQASKSAALSESEGSLAMDGPVIGDLCIKSNVPGEGDLEAFDHSLPPDDLLPIPGAFTATVQDNITMTPPDHWQDVRHINIFLDARVSYHPGDCISIYPKNFPEDVDGLIKLMDWTTDADKPLTFVRTAGSSFDPGFIPILQNIFHTDPPTLRSLLLHNLDITAIPRRFFFEVIAKFTSDPMHRDRLLEFTNPAYTDEFFDYTTRPRRSILEVLHDFPSVRLPWRWVPYIFPILRPRQFSISSGGYLKHPHHNTTAVHICVAIVKYRTVLKKIRRGVCSRYLASLRPGTEIQITFHRGSFAVSDTHATKPLLMIAPGTGVAPMRSLLWERAGWFDDSEMEAPPEAVLIFGGRNKTKDFLYEADWKKPELNVKVLTAWSRDQAKKIYVQDVIRKQAEMIWRLLVVEGGSVFVCGSSGKMPMAVRAAILEAFVRVTEKLEGESPIEKAEMELAKIEKEGRYVQETW